MGIDHRGLPLAMQIIGPQGSDRRVLAIGELFKSVTAYHKRQPKP
ncbi:hypothetical protein IB244_23580 [Rhizobium sp. RHZ02]|nr:hypothetical protein [Rhizobium sp. RHZ02]